MRRIVLVLLMAVALMGNSLLLAPTPVAIAQDAGQPASDSFSRTVASGWGAADSGGSWRLLTDAGASVNGSQGLIFVPRGEVRSALLGDSQGGPVQVSTAFSLVELPTSGEISTGIMLRRDAGSFAFARVRTDRSGESFLGISAHLDGRSAWLVTPEVPIGRVAGGGMVRLKAGVDLQGEGLAVAKAWLDGQPEPAGWQVIGGDPALPSVGEFGLRAESSPIASGVAIAFDDYDARPVSANQPPVASFTVSTNELEVSVDASASSDPDGRIASYRWDYGDGTTATGVRPPRKVYAEPGTYTIRLTVTDDAGATAAQTREVTLERGNAAPTARFSAEIKALRVNVDAAQSTDDDGRIVDYRWNFGDGTSAQGVSASHEYAAAGSYTITLEVIDDAGAVGTAEQQVVVDANQAPTAEIAFNVRGLQLLVGGGLSTDLDGEIVSYEWDFGDGTTATGVRPPVHTYSAPGTYTVSLRVVDDLGASGSTTKEITVEGATVSAPGASLPILYDLSDLPGTVRFVAPTGSDESGNGSVERPYRTLKRAVAMSKAGDSVVLRGGTYAIEENATTVGKANLLITAYPGEVPVFDGSIPAPQTANTEGNLRWIEYQPMPAKPGEGLSVNQLPEAKFDASGNPVGLALERGWRCVTSSGSFRSVIFDGETEIEIPHEEPMPRASGSGCPSGTKPRVISGYFPDQVWVGNRHLTQVLSKDKVRPGTFFVPREYATDATPGPSRIYLSPQDAADLSQVRVSSSNGNFLHIAASGVKLRGFEVRRHSPAWPFFALSVTANANDIGVQDVVLDYVTSVASKVAGSDASGGAGITKNALLDKVTITNASWIGLSSLYTDGLTVSNSVIRNSNYDLEFATAPKSGGIKATKTHDMLVVNSDISQNNGHGVWWDQSNYNATLANSRLDSNSDSAVFYEISHGLRLVNNIITRGKSPSSSPTVRLAGASSVLVVNNTIVGGQVPLALAADPRSKLFGSNKRPCAEHPERYRQGGSVAADCPPALSSDLDRARSGEFGPGTNITPGLNWRPSAVALVNNVLAGAIPGSGGICPGGYLLCVKSYSGSASSPSVVVPTKDVLRSNLVMNGNVYQSDGSLMQLLTPNSDGSGFKANSLDELRKRLAAPAIGLTAEANALAGTGYVNPDGTATPALQQLHGQAAAVPVDPVVNAYVPAGTRHYGALNMATGEPPAPSSIPQPSFTYSVDQNSVEFDASATTVPDGTPIKLFGWYFGDKTDVQYGERVEHVYSEPGEYKVILVAVAESGAFGFTSQTVKVGRALSAVLASDSFARTTSSGWGTADTGGTWKLAGSASRFSVSGGRGAMALDPAVGLRAVLPLNAPSADASILVGSGQKLTGGGVFVSLMPRVASDNSAYRAKVAIGSDGRAQLSLTRLNSANQETTLAKAPSALSGLSTTKGLRIRAAAVGSTPTQLAAKIWVDGQPEPEDWQVLATDNTAALQGAGGVGVFAYEAKSATKPVRWLVDDLMVVKPEE